MAFDCNNDETVEPTLFTETVVQETTFSTKLDNVSTLWSVAGNFTALLETSNGPQPEANRDCCAPVCKLKQ